MGYHRRADHAHVAHAGHGWLQAWRPWIPWSRQGPGWWFRSREGLPKLGAPHPPHRGTIDTLANCSFIQRSADLHHEQHGHLVLHDHVLGHVHGQMVCDGHLRLRRHLHLRLQHPHPSRQLVQACGQAEQRPCDQGSPCRRVQQWRAQPRLG
jgi:hypothetical protein